MYSVRGMDVLTDGLHRGRPANAQKGFAAELPRNTFGGVVASNVCIGSRRQFCAPACVGKQLDHFAGEGIWRVGQEDVVSINSVELFRAQGRAHDRFSHRHRFKNLQSCSATDS